LLAVFLSYGWLREFRHRRSLQIILRRAFQRGVQADGLFCQKSQPSPEEPFPF
jgi:hypothetical protein